MSVTFGRLARALLLTTGIAIAIALPSLVGTPLMPSPGDPGARIALAAPAAEAQPRQVRPAWEVDEAASGRSSIHVRASA